jgi:hypothetical protein
MRYKILMSSLAAAVVLMLSSLAAVHAATLLEGKGSLSGTVKDDAGKPVVGLALRLEFDQPMGMNPGGGKTHGKGKISVGDSGARELQGKPNPRTKIVGRATTDQNGNFLFSNIDEGSFRLVAGNKAQGWIYQDVEVKANEETKLGEMKLVKVK